MSKETMPTHSGLRAMEERARKALEGNAEPNMSQEDPMVRVKVRSPKGQSYHFFALRSQVGQLMGA